VGAHFGDVKDHRVVDIAVRSVTDPPALRGLMLALFQQRDVPEPVGDIVVTGNADERVREMEQELAATQEHLQTTIEELETSNASHHPLLKSSS